MPDKEIDSFPNQHRWEEILKNRRLAESLPAVYAIVSDKRFGRLSGESKVLYVGKATCLGGSGDSSRLYAYRYQKADSRDGRIRELAKKATLLGHNLTLKWQVLESEPEASSAERRILEKYIEHHLEVPPLNSKAK